MAKRHIFNRQMQHILRLSDEHAPVIKTIQKNSLAATRCQLDMPFDAVTNPSPRDDAYMIVIQIHGKNSRELWLDGRPIKTEPLYAGGVVFHDLRQGPRFYFHDPLDAVNFYLPRKTLDAIADDADAPRISDLKFTPGVGVMDPDATAFAGIRQSRPGLPALCGSYQPGFGRSYRPDLWRHETRRWAVARRSRHMAGTARERAHGRKPSERCFHCGCRDGMRAIGRSFRSRVSAFDGFVAAPMVAPTSD